MSCDLERQIKELTKSNEQLRNELYEVESGNIRLWKKYEVLRKTLYKLVKDILILYDDEEINDKQFKEIVELMTRSTIGERDW